MIKLLAFGWLRCCARSQRLLLPLTATLLFLGCSQQLTVADTLPLVGVQSSSKPRVIVLTDISNEPDDSESMVRLLVSAPLEITACAGESVRLNASGSRDPDGQPLAWRWWRYAEPTGSLPVSSPRIDTTDAIETTVILPTLKTPPPPQFLHHVAYRFHVIVEATDNGMPPLTRYRRRGHHRAPATRSD
jgi:hypothetical protein